MFMPLRWFKFDDQWEFQRNDALRASPEHATCKAKERSTNPTPPEVGKTPSEALLQLETTLAPHPNTTRRTKP